MRGHLSLPSLPRLTDTASFLFELHGPYSQAREHIYLDTETFKKLSEINRRFSNALISK